MRRPFGYRLSAIGSALLAPALASVPAGRATAQTKPDFEVHRELAPGRRFYLANIIGDVQITGGTGRMLEVTAIKKAHREGDPRDVVIELVELDDGIAVCVRYPGTRHRSSSATPKAEHPCSSQEGRWGWDGNDRNDTEVNFTVRVPPGLRLEIGTVSGDVAAESLDGEIELHSVSGDVGLHGGRGSRIGLKTVSGDLELLEVVSKDVSAQTVSGEITFRGPVQDSGTYDFATTSGDIALALPGRPNATLKAATFSGDFASDLPVNQDEPRRHRHRFDATWGSGSAKLYLESLSGDVTIRVGSTSKRS